MGQERAIFCDEVKKKCRRLPRVPGLSIRTALVYSGELAKSVEAEGYFDALVPFARLIGLNPRAAKTR